MSDFMVPDMIEPIVAWRVWRVNFNGLNSLNHEMAWPYRKRAEARCHHSEPTTRNVVGWEAVSSVGETTWIRDALEGEQLEEHWTSEMVYGGPTGPTGLTYYPTPVAYSSSSMVVRSVAREDLPTEPSGLVLPNGWEWRIGYRQEQYPPVHTTSPGEECACGIYALRSRDMGSHYLSDADAWGEVYLWGKVIEAEFGYRAQYAYPKSLEIAARGYEQNLAGYEVPVEVAGAVQVAFSKALPTGPKRRGIRIAISANLIAFAFNLLLAAFVGVSVVTIVALFINVIAILILMIISALMSR